MAMYGGSKVTAPLHTALHRRRLSPIRVAHTGTPVITQCRTLLGGNMCGALVIGAAERHSLYPTVERVLSW